jgi:hypothetical protein
MPPSTSRASRGPRRARPVVACAAATVLTFGVSVGGASAATVSPTRAAAACPATVDATRFSTTKQLRALTTKLAGFGLRSPGSAQHQRELAWLEQQLRAVPGMQVHADPYEIDRWQPTPKAPGKPGRDLARAGALTVTTNRAARTVPVSGAVPFSLPNGVHGLSGPLVYLSADTPITAANAQGKVVVRDVPPASTPYSVFPVIAHYLTPDWPSSGNYERPYASPLDPTLIDAGKAGAAGVVFLWDVPTAQVRGYWDPHTGTRFRVPAVYAGAPQAATIKRLATQGRTAHVVVRAKWDRATTRNLFGSLPGQTRERIVVNSHTDGVTWVQENGPVGVLALARYLGSLPAACRHRDVEFALTSDHLGFTNDGTFRYAKQLDADFDQGTVAFVLSMEHLGPREILPTGPGHRLEFTGKGEPIVWSAPEESPPLVQAAVAAVKRRKLDRTAVVKGTEAPVAGRVPEYCAQGGLGGNFNAHLLPTTSAITGPWSLWAPSFGARAVDFARMRREILAVSDVARALDDTPRADIAGTYAAERQRRAEGAPTCDILTPPPAVAPGP